LTNCSGDASCGSVGYAYYISKYEVTNAQYAEFLNAKAASDPLGLYNPVMGSDANNGGIVQSGSNGSYTYSVKAGFASKPVTMVSFHDSLRFTNWLSNGQGSGDTETGAYTITAGGIATNSITRNALATTFLPSENEWYKAAFFDPATSSYFTYPTGSNTQPVCGAPGATPNTANCDAPGFDASDPDVDGVTTVGAFTGSASPYGTFDQGGNVWEWNEKKFISFDVRGIRNGGWEIGALRLARNQGGSAGAAFENTTIGFRVASLVPEPGTGLLVMTGLLGFAYRQRRLRRAA
jgi:formylglycine-generating enzyme required for sulfatase activity